MWGTICPLHHLHHLHHVSVPHKTLAQLVTDNNQVRGGGYYWSEPEMLIRPPLTLWDPWHKCMLMNLCSCKGTTSRSLPTYVQCDQCSVAYDFGECSILVLEDLLQSGR